MLWGGRFPQELEGCDLPLIALTNPWPIRTLNGSKDGPYLPYGTGVQTHLGRLGIVEEGGKRRFRTIRNYVNQRLRFAPYHDWLMKVLGTIPMDGTFDQTRPLDRLKGVSDVYSFDFQSATDRWPLTLLTVLMTLFLKSRSLSSSITQSTLALNTFVIGKPHVRKDKVLTFTAG